MPHIRNVAFLDALYQQVNDYDNLQEKLTTACVQLTKLDKEREIYNKMDIPDIITNVIKSVDYEEGLLNDEIAMIEAQLSLIDIESILMAISKMEDKVKTLT